MAKSFRRRAPGTGRIGLLLQAKVERLRRRGVERITASPATEKAVGSLHRAATGLAEVTSEVNAYAGLLEEKTGELQAKTRARRDALLRKSFPQPLTVKPSLVRSAEVGKCPPRTA